VLIKVR